MKTIKQFKGNWIRHGFETLYVIVGILIAFSLDDWNKNRNAQNTEISVLNELISALSTDSATLNFNLNQHVQAIKSCEIVLRALNGPDEYNDSLAFHFASIHNYTHFGSDHGPYESLKSLGLETVSNKSLRLELIDLYDQWHTVLLSNQKILTDDILELKRNFLPDHFDKFLVVVPHEPYYEGEMIPVDFDKLKSNQQIKYHIKSLHAAHSFHVMQQNFVKDKVDGLISACQNEIERLKGKNRKQ